MALMASRRTPCTYPGGAQMWPFGHIWRVHEGQKGPVRSIVGVSGPTAGRAWTGDTGVCQKGPFSWKSGKNDENMTNIDIADK